jgi:hypothetical protein
MLSRGVVINGVEVQNGAARPSKKSDLEAATVKPARLGFTVKEGGMEFRKIEIRVDWVFATPFSLDKGISFQQNSTPETSFYRAISEEWATVSDHAASVGPETLGSQTAGTAPASSKLDPSRVWVDDGEGHSAGTSLASPEFDGSEVASFGQEDGHAVTVIGKMLVGFFFYSFLIMLGVAIWTMSRGGQVDPNASHAQHAEESEE